MNKEYIEREALLNLIEENSETKFDWSECVDIDILRPAILDMPAADVAPVVHGEWIQRMWKSECDWGSISHRGITCSACKVEFVDKEPTNYCPNCGAKMDGGNK